MFYVRIIKRKDVNMYKNFVKRILDIILSVLAIAILLIPMLVILFITYIDSPDPVIFVQKRLGKNKKEFNIFKIRSMPNDVQHYINTSNFTEVDKLSKWQLFIRKTSIDELPQILNILKGDMSWIGPRPIISMETELVNERDKYNVYDCLPGITGWAQINGRDVIDLFTKAKLDGEYVDALNEGGLTAFKMDLRCFFGTVKKVISCEDVVEGPSEK